MEEVEEQTLEAGQVLPASSTGQQYNPHIVNLSMEEKRKQIMEEFTPKVELVDVELNMDEDKIATYKEVCSNWIDSSKVVQFPLERVTRKGMCAPLSLLSLSLLQLYSEPRHNKPFTTLLLSYNPTSIS